jgi:cytochrome b pre-mRNA-processing protein 3
MLFGLFRRSEPEPFALYGSIVAQARQPALYAGLGVPDTLDGRFDMLVLHLVLVLRRLRGAGERAGARAQALVDLFTADMDRSLREMGVGDLTVPKRVKTMAEAFYGRLEAYVAALDAGDAAALEAALARNVLPDGGEGAGRLAAYAAAAAASLEAASLDDILEGRLGLPDPAAIPAETAP